MLARGRHWHVRRCAPSMCQPASPPARQPASSPARTLPWRTCMCARHGYTGALLWAHLTAVQHSPGTLAPEYSRRVSAGREGEGMAPRTVRWDWAKWDSAERRPGNSHLVTNEIMVGHSFSATTGGFVLSPFRIAYLSFFEDGFREDKGSGKTKDPER